MYSEEIEKDVILSCLKDEKFMGEVYQILSPNHFNNLPYKWVYWANKESQGIIGYPIYHLYAIFSPASLGKN